MNVEGSLEGRIALVTGAARGLGFAIAQRLVRAGASVWLNGRDRAALGDAADRIGGDARVLAFDIGDDEATAAAFKTLAEDGLDILVNNVGQRDRRSLAQLRREDMAAMLATGSMAETSVCPSPTSRRMTLHGSIAPMRGSACIAWNASGGLQAPRMV